MQIEGLCMTEPNHSSQESVRAEVKFVRGRIEPRVPEIDNYSASPEKMSSTGMNFGGGCWILKQRPEEFYLRADLYFCGFPPKR